MTYVIERLFLVVGLVFLFCLMLTLAPPGLVFGDGAELTYGILNAQVIHPPGYPLYTLLGRGLLSVSPVGAPLTASMLSALFSCLSLTVFYLFMRRREVGFVSSLLVVLVLAFAYPVWDLSVKPEVYSLAAFLFLSTLFFWDCVLRDGNGRSVLWFVAGLSLTHHPLGVFNALLALHATWKTSPGFRIRDGVIFLAPFLLYGTMLVPGQNFPFNWPEVRGLAGLVQHVTGGSFSRFFLVHGFLTPLEQSGRIAMAHLVAFPFFLIPLVAMGYAVIHRDLLPVVVLQGLLLVGLSFYGVPDLHDFLLPSYFVTGLALSFGLDWVGGKLAFGRVLMVVLILLSYGMLFYLLGGGLRYDWRNYEYPEEYAGSVREVAQEGVILSDWAHYSVLKYYQLTEGYYSGIHLLSPVHRYRRWPDIIRFHQKRGHRVFTTIRTWHPPDGFQLERVGPLFEPSYSK